MKGPEQKNTLYRCCSGTRVNNLDHPHIYHRKIKVFQLGSSSGLYGAEHWILALARNLDQKVVTTYIGTLRDEEHVPPICIQANKEGFSTYVIDCKRKLSVASVIELKKILEQNKIDILHTHGYKTDTVGLLAARMASRKIISTPHGWSKKADIKLRIYEAMDRIVLAFCDAVVPLSKQIYQELWMLPGIRRKLFYVRNGVDIIEVDSVSKPANDIMQWRKKGDFVIGYIGRLDPGKAVDTILRALAYHGKDHWKVAIVGDGPENLRLKALSNELGITEKIRFFGYRTDRIAILKGFDVFVLPSISEGIPRCLMEAMAACIPVLASDIVGCRYLVDHEKTGLLFEPNNPYALAIALERLEIDKDFAQRVTLRAREKICGQYSARLMASEYEKLYLSLLRSW